MWSPIPLADRVFPERLIGFSLPVAGEIALVSYQGVHLLHLGDSASIHDDLNHPEGKGLYDPGSGKLLYQQKTYAILGLHGGNPILESPRKERLDLDLRNETLRILGPRGSKDFELRFEDLSGDWGYATFSEDSEWVILGLPYELRLLKRG